MDNNNLRVLILAGGFGTRMHSEKPKVIHNVCGMPVLAHIIFQAQALNPQAVCVVVGHKGQMVQAETEKEMALWETKCPVNFIEQKELTGSGQAVKEALQTIEGSGDLMVICGDTPLIQTQTLADLYNEYKVSQTKACVLTCKISDPFGYGRIVRLENGFLDKIVEESDADKNTALINEINSGMYVFSIDELRANILKLTPKGEKKEYYLTDVIEHLRTQGHNVGALLSDKFEELLGINNRVQLAQAEAIMQARILNALMLSGVTVVNPSAAYVDFGVVINKDSIIEPGACIKGKTVIGENCLIGPNCIIEDSKLNNNCIIKAGSIITGSVLEDDCTVGPYAHVRPGCELMQGAKVGNFSETKKAIIGKSSKVPHLSYIGDAVLGQNVNIGAGTITCNYDGKAKHQTVIGDNSFIGSNTNLVAPIKLGNNVIVGAGSTLTQDVEDNSLAIARERQTVKPLRR